MMILHKINKYRPQAARAWTDHMNFIPNRKDDLHLQYYVQSEFDKQIGYVIRAYKWDGSCTNIGVWHDVELLHQIDGESEKTFFIIFSSHIGLQTNGTNDT